MRNIFLMQSKHMQAVILAAGASSRFYPYNQEEHKSFVTVMGKPLIEHTIEALKEAKIQEVIIVVKPNSKIKEHLGDGKRFGLSIKYVIQQEPLGMGHGLLQAKELLQDNFFLLSGYHMEFGKFKKEMEKKQKNNCVVLVKKSDDNLQYGAVELDKDIATRIIEKPTAASSPYRLIAIYLLTKEFLSVLDQTPPAEYQFEDALDTMAKKRKIKAVVTQESTISLKFPWQLLEIKDYLLATLKKQTIASQTHIAKDAILSGDVFVDEGATIMEGVCIKGPAYIGKNVVIGNRAILRGGVTVEEGAVIGSGMELKNTHVMQSATTHSGFIGDSIVGKNTKIAAYMCTANVRLDREPVKVVVKNEKVNTKIKHLGAIIGNNANLGIRVSTMPGVIIGNNTIIGPSTNVMKNVADNTKYYTKFQEVIEEKNGEK